MVVDATGVAYEGERALTALCATANAPIFTHDHAFFGHEVVGGPMLSAIVLGKEASAVAVRILGGEKAGQIKVEPIGFAAPIYDWRELRRWGISESRLPPGSEVLFRDPSRGDRIQLQQVILNLIVNAIDAMSEVPSAERQIIVRTLRMPRLLFPTQAPVFLRKN
jgi:hypothetical protein